MLLVQFLKLKSKHFYMPKVVTQFKKHPEGHWGNFSNNLFVKTT